MDLYAAWTLIICIATSNTQTACDMNRRIWITGTQVYHSDEDCEAGWQEHIRRLNARPGWRGLVLVDSELCGWGGPNKSDPLYDLREENLRWPANSFNPYPHLARVTKPSPRADSQPRGITAPGVLPRFAGPQRGRHVFASTMNRVARSAADGWRAAGFSNLT